MQRGWDRIGSLLGTGPHALPRVNRGLFLCLLLPSPQPSGRGTRPHLKPLLSSKQFAQFQAEELAWRAARRQILEWVEAWDPAWGFGAGNPERMGWRGVEGRREVSVCRGCH